MGRLIQKSVLLYCGVNPSEIDRMDNSEVELFMVFFEEMKKSEMGAFNGRK